MRITLELDDDLVAAAKRLGKRRGTTVGQVISQLAQQSLVAESLLKIRNGVPVFAPSRSPVKPDLRLISELRDGA